MTADKRHIKLKSARKKDVIKRLYFELHIVKMSPRPPSFYRKKRKIKPEVTKML